MDRRISVRRVADYEQGALRDAVRAHFEALGVVADLTPQTRVLLKPNLLMRRAPERVTTTHPALVEAVLYELRRLGVERVTLADSPGGPYNKALLGGVYETTGMRAACAAHGATCNVDTGFAPAQCERPDAVCRSFNLLTPVLEADYIINLPRLKTHGMMTLSGAVKNLFGCIPGLEKSQLHFRYPEHERFAAMLCDLALTVRPALTIVDAVVAMEGDGPSSGQARALGYTFAARDPFCLDQALGRLTGFPPETLYTVANAIERGLCPADAAELDYLGDGEPPVVERFVLPRSREPDFSGALPGPLKALARRITAPRPKIHRAQCIGCGRCAESCPPQVIAVQNGKARIDYRGCIRCYCCHEMCPVRAIGIRRPGIFGI